MQTVTEYIIPLAVAGVVFLVLLGVTIFLLLHVAPRNGANRERPDYRVVHFTLRVAFTFGIGAVIVSILLVAAYLRYGLLLK